MKSLIFVLCTLCGVISVSEIALCQVPQTLTYTGLLSEGGIPAEASVKLTFTLYDAASGGNDVWSETFENVDVDNGRFTVAMGSTENIVPVLDGNVYWLEVSVNDGPGLLPRSAFDSVPYAIRAKDADTLNGQTIQQIQDGVVQASIDVAYNNSTSGLSATTVQSAVDELASRPATFTMPRHATTHQNGGSDEINVTGLNGLLADPQTPTAHSHDDQYYTETEVDAEVVKKVALHSQTFTDIFTSAPANGSPFTCSPTGFTGGAGEVPIVSVSLTGFNSIAKPRFYYNYEIIGSDVLVHVYNGDGDEVVDSAVGIMAWNNVNLRIDIIWTDF